MSGEAKYITRFVQVGPEESEKKIPFIKTVRTVTNPHIVDRKQLADAIAQTCNELDEQGYDIISIFPTLRGESKATPRSGYGYSVTDGAVITAKKTN